MAFIPIVATRFAKQYTITSGSATEITSTITWPSITVDYGNEGATDEPPTRSYTNEVDYGDTNSASLGRGVAILIPLSNESIFEQDPLGDEELKCSVKWIKRLRRFL